MRNLVILFETFWGIYNMEFDKFGVEGSIISYLQKDNFLEYWNQPLLVIIYTHWSTTSRKARPEPAPIQCSDFMYVFQNKHVLGGRTHLQVLSCIYFYTLSKCICSPHLLLTAPWPFTYHNETPLCCTNILAGRKKMKIPKDWERN